MGLLWEFQLSLSKDYSNKLKYFFSQEYFKSNQNWFIRLTADLSFYLLIHLLAARVFTGLSDKFDIIMQFARGLYYLEQGHPLTVIL